MLKKVILIAALAILLSVMPAKTEIENDLDSLSIKDTAETKAQPDSTNENKDTGILGKLNQMGALRPAEPLDLRELFVLDNLFEGSKLLDKSGTTLRDMLILDSLFNDKMIFSGNNNYNFSELFIIDKLLNENSSLLDKDTTSIEDLIILDQLFNRR